MSGQERKPVHVPTILAAAIVLSVAAVMVFGYGVLLLSLL